VTNELFDGEAEDRTVLFRRPSLPKEDGTAANWRHWIQAWRERLDDGRDLVIVIDADRREGATRIGKSTLGLTVLAELDRTFTAESIPDRVAGGASDLARYVTGCRRGQGFLYDEGMWGARSRDAMSPDAKMVGEVLGTLASRGAIVVFCAHSMLSLDTEVKALAAVRLLVRQRGLAEVHTPEVQLDLERPRLLPFRENEISPITWRRLRGPIWEAYSTRKTQLQDARMARELEAQRVWEARRLGQPTNSKSSDVPAGGPLKGPAPPPRTYTCPGCGQTWGDAFSRNRHAARCAAALAAARPAPESFTR
jgi:hypothetical protein